MRPLTSLKNMRQVRGPSTRLGSQIRLESVQSQRDSVATAKLPPCAPIRGCGATETWTAGYGRRGDDGRRARGEHGGRSGRDGAVDARGGAGACRWGGGGGRTRAGGRRGNETGGLREGDGRRGGGGGRAGRLDGRYEAVRVGRVREGCVGKGWSAGKETDAAHTGEATHAAGQRSEPCCGRVEGVLREANLHSRRRRQARKRPSELRLRALRNRLVLLRPQITRPGPRDWLDGRCIAYDRMDTLRLSLPPSTRINAVDSSRVSLASPSLIQSIQHSSITLWGSLCLTGMSLVHSSAQTRRCPLIKSMTGSEK